MLNSFRTGRPTNVKLSIQTEHEDPYHGQAPWLPRSEVKVARSRADRCWPISRERNVVETPKQVKRPTPRAIMHTSFKVKGHQVDWCWDRKCVIPFERKGIQTSNLVHSVQRGRTKTRIIVKLRERQRQRPRSRWHVVCLTDVGP